MQYIYCITKVDEDHFVFSVDPTVDDPGEFGSPVVTTEALKKAANGTPAVDDVPYEDEWGRFYSAYSPIYDSNGNIVAVLAVDFSARQYERNIWRNTLIVIAISLLALTGGAGLVYIMTNRLRKRFNSLYGDLSSLSDSIEGLTDRITDKKFRASYIDKQKETEYEGKDEIAKLNAKIRSMQDELSLYMDYIYEMAYTDGLTGVKNKTAYFEKVHPIDDKIKEGAANFSVAVFDINGLKKMNDNFGHEYGDRMIADLVKIMAEVFGEQNVYRIGGDEFIAVLENTDAEQMKEYFRIIDEKVAFFNENDKTYSAPIGFSKGTATFIKDKDTEYRAVFKRADERMYADKQAFYADKCVVYGFSKPGEEN